MSDEEREKAATTSDEIVHEHHLAHEPHRHQVHHPSAEVELAHGHGRRHAKHEQQPGGGRYSDSEKPDSPESRWGGGRGDDTEPARH